MRRRALELASLAILLVGRGASRAGDAPPSRADDAPRLSTIDFDPNGVAAPADAAALRRLEGTDGASDPVGAATLWMDLADRDPAALLPMPAERRLLGSGGIDAGLHASAREVALARLGALPEAGRAAVEARWGPRAAAALRAALAVPPPTAVPALEEIVARWPVTEAGDDATILVADRRIEEGDPSSAARHLSRWMRLHPFAAPARVASVAARLADALVEAEDEAGILLLARRLAAIPATTTTTVSGRTVSAADLPGRALAACRSRVAARAAEPRPPPLPVERLSRLWSLDVTDAGLVPRRDPRSEPPTARVAVDGDDLFLVEARRVRRVDRDTGLVRWSYPEGPLPRDHDPVARARSFERPVRDVVTAGGLVLAVLGDPVVPPTGTFFSDGELVAATELARETRPRIVALDRSDGRPVWWSGRIDEADPVVGAADVGVVSPLLVDGDSVQAVFAARRGVVETWLVRLDLRTGRVLRTTPLVRAESGLVSPSDDDDLPRKLVDLRVRSLPRAQRPVRSGDEIVVVTGVGAVVGVDARTGAARWAQALPRFGRSSRGDVDSASLGSEGTEHSSRNEPLAAFGAWVVAAEDATAPVALEHGSGRLRWIGPDPDATSPPPGTDDEPPADRVRSRHLVALEPGSDGRGRAWFAGDEPSAFEAREIVAGRPIPGSGLSAWALPTFRGRSSELVGRPAYVGGSLYAFRGSVARAADPGRGRAGLAERAASASPTAIPDVGPLSGDLVRAGDLWVLVDADRIGAFAPVETALALARSSGRDAADRAARACLLARLAPSRAATSAAVAACAGAPAARAQALPDAIDAFLLASEGVAQASDPTTLKTVLEPVDALDVPARAVAYRRIFRSLEREGRAEAAVALLDAWLAFGDGAWLDVEREGRVRVRSDALAAHEILPFAARSPAGRAALERREPAAERLLAAAEGISEGAVETALRRTAGTRAAFLARVRRLGRLVDAGAGADAAAACADLRTGAPPGVDLGSAAAHALRGIEADLLAGLGERRAAREAWFDADRDGPALARDVHGGPLAPLGVAVSALSDGPVRGEERRARLELFRSVRSPGAIERRDARILEPSGPGADVEPVRLVVARGLEREVVSWPDGATVPIAGVDLGYLGAVLQDRETSLPGPGVRIASVTQGSAADRGGLREGDWILRFGDAPATDRDALVRAIAAAPLGATVPVAGVRSSRPFVRPVVAASRGRDDRAPATPDVCRVLADGTALVPSRFGVSRVSLADGRSASLWRSHGRGEVEAIVGLGDALHVVLSSSPLGDSTVVTLDARTGGERSSTSIEGRVHGAPRIVGSALVVDTRAPQRTWILDRATGALRASHAGMGVRPVPSDLVEPGVSVDAGGSVFLWREGAGEQPFLSGLDPATGTATWHHVPSLATGGRLFGLPIAGGALLATASVDEAIDVFLPDLRGGIEPFGAIRVDGSRFGSQRWGVLDGDSRLGVGGDVVYVARVASDRQASLGGVEIDRRRARGLSPEDPAIWHPPSEALLPSRESVTVGDANDAFATITAFRAGPDGAWIAATTWHPRAEGASGRTVWVSAVDEAYAPIPTSSTVLYDRPPVLAGPYAFVPTDGGYLVVPRRTADPR